MSKSIDVKILRSDLQARSGYYETYTVPYFDHMDLLDVLKYIKQNIDPTLAFRYSCEEGKCGLCGILLNGEPVLACKETVSSDQNLILEPLPDYPVIQDLFVDRGPYNQQIRRLQKEAEEQYDGKDRAGQSKIPSGKGSDFFELENCIECGLCALSCPASMAGHNELSGPVGFLQSVVPGFFHSPVGITKKGAEELFNCFQCQQCFEMCPRDVDVPELVRKTRGELGKSKAPSGIRKLATNLDNTQNLLSRSGYQNVPSTSAWMNRADQRLLNRIGKRESEVGLFIGCQFGTRAQLQFKIFKLTDLFFEAGIEFTLLGQEEWCCGHPLYATDDTGASKKLITHNVNKFKELGVDKVITGCPGCYNAFEQEYTEVAETSLPFEIQHSTQFLIDLVERNDLKFRPVEVSVTYHDPCELGRLNGIYSEPREVLETIPGLCLTEFENNKANSLCCGGGGLTSPVNKNLSDRVTQERLRALEEMSSNTLVTSCPTCEFTFASMARKGDYANDIVILDLIDLVHKAVFGES